MDLMGPGSMGWPRVCFCEFNRFKDAVKKPTHELTCLGHYLAQEGEMCIVHYHFI